MDQLPESPGKKEEAILNKDKSAKKTKKEKNEANLAKANDKLKKIRAEKEQIMKKHLEK